MSDRVVASIQTNESEWLRVKCLHTGAVALIVVTGLVSPEFDVIELCPNGVKELRTELAIRTTARAEIETGNGGMILVANNRIDGSTALFHVDHDRNVKRAMLLSRQATRGLITGLDQARCVVDAAGFMREAIT